MPEQFALFRLVVRREVLLSHQRDVGVSLSRAAGFSTREASHGSRCRACMDRVLNAPGEVPEKLASASGLCEGVLSCHRGKPIGLRGAAFLVAQGRFNATAQMRTHAAALRTRV